MATFLKRFNEIIFSFFEILQNFNQCHNDTKIKLLLIYIYIEMLTISALCSYKLHPHQ